MINHYDLSVQEFAGAIGHADMDEDQRAFAAALFAALGNPTRLRIVELLISGEMTVNDVADAVAISQSNASLSLSILQRAGIVKATPRGTQRRYSLRGPRIVHMIMLTKQFRDVHAGAIRFESLLGDDHVPTVTAIISDKAEQS